MSDLAVTDRQAEVFAFLEHFIEERGYAPTRAEISKHFGFRSVNAADQHLRALAKKGAIRLDDHISRGVVLLARTK